MLLLGNTTQGGEKLPKAVNFSKKMDVTAIRLRASAFRKQLKDLKSRVSLIDAEWYPYDTLSCWDTLDRLLTGDRRNLLDFTRAGSVLDLGCADGDESFFLESLGCQVEALDNPTVNHSRFAGFQTIRMAFKSGVPIAPIDLDSGPRLEKTYDLCFFLGVLYHLKNPLYALELLARHCRFCLLSTRIASLDPARLTDFSHLPVAYLVGESETNNDSTNFWIFSETGLRRAVNRAGWQICDWLTVGCDKPPDPVHADADGRVFCLLKSTWMSAPELRLLDGWHAAEPGNWRWTERRFSLRLEGVEATATPILELHFSVPSAVLPLRQTVTLWATVNGIRLASQTYNSAGDHIYRQALPATNGPLDIQFEMDQPLPGYHADARELGVVVRFHEDAPVRLVS